MHLKFSVVSTSSRFCKCPAEILCGYKMRIGIVYVRNSIFSIGVMFVKLGEKER